MAIKQMTLQMAGTDSTHPMEDAVQIDTENAIVVVADGVTRTAQANGMYPEPSPAKLAAEAVCLTVVANLAQKIPGMAGIRQAIAASNSAVDTVNAQLGLKQTDYFIHDLAGTVAAAAVLSGKKAFCGYIGDCGVAVLNRAGKITWQSQDDVIRARKYFPSPQQIPSKKERIVQIRRDHRNKPNAPHPTYGVLTGESEALAYVHTAELTLNAEDTLLVFSDGAAPLLKDKSARKLILEFSKDSLEQFILQQRQHGNEQLGAELTLVALQTPRN